mmetsp:Transcript_13789/g.24093  ORF Transcript_13789/g.24093 Transcript_13789/m.24093 type:complete len:332 (-) Transcript_13789:245-1240(-)
MHLLPRLFRVLARAAMLVLLSVATSAVWMVSGVLLWMHVVLRVATSVVRVVSRMLSGVLFRMLLRMVLRMLLIAVLVASFVAGTQIHGAFRTSTLTCCHGIVLMILRLMRRFSAVWLLLMLFMGHTHILRLLITRGRFFRMLSALRAAIMMSAAFRWIPGLRLMFHIISAGITCCSHAFGLGVSLCVHLVHLGRCLIRVMLLFVQSFGVVLMRLRLPFRVWLRLCRSLLLLLSHVILRRTCQGLRCRCCHLRPIISIIDIEVLKQRCLRCLPSVGAHRLTGDWLRLFRHCFSIRTSRDCSEDDNCQRQSSHYCQQRLDTDWQWLVGFVLPR